MTRWTTAAAAIAIAAMPTWLQAQSQVAPTPSTEVPKNADATEGALNNNETDAAGNLIFMCKGGRTLLFRAEVRNAELQAIVNAGEGAHVLSPTEWRLGQPNQIRWTDGRRTLVWAPGVDILWVDGDSELICGRGGKRLNDFP